MANILSANTIQALWTALERSPPRANAWHGAKLLARIAEEGWASKADIEDIFYLYDPRLDRAVEIDDLCNVFRLPWRTTFYRPKARSNGVTGFRALVAADVADLLIQIERFGFVVDPTPLIEAMIPKIKSLKRITNSELSILWFAKYRHKMAAQVVQVDGQPLAAREIKRLATATGYKAELWLDADNQPVLLSVVAPKFRRLPNPREVVCPDCGYTWYRGDPDSSANHRREHKVRMRVLNPAPHPLIARARLAEIEPELVTSKSPVWKHKEIHARAVFFRREFHYDFVQWGSSTGDDDPDVHGFLFADDAGAIVGACAFRLRNSGGNKYWGLQWVWVCPRARRSGVLSQRWPIFKQRFGEFQVEGPVSPTMEAFVVKKGDTALLGYDPLSKPT